MKNQINIILIRMVGLLLLIAVGLSSVVYDACPSEAAYVYPYGVYKSTGDWAGLKLDYEYASGPGKDFITIYVKGDRSAPIASETLKKVKGTQNKYRTTGDKKHYLTLTVYKKKIIVREVAKRINTHYMFAENAKLTFKKIRTLQLP